MCPQDVFFFANAGAIGPMGKKKCVVREPTLLQSESQSEREREQEREQHREREREKTKTKKKTGANTEAGKPPTAGIQRKLRKQTLRNNIFRDPELFPKLRKRTLCKNILRELFSKNYELKT